MSRIIEPREVWRAWVAFEDNPREGKLRPVIVVHVDMKNRFALTIPIYSRVAQGEYEIALFDWAEIPIDHLPTANIAKSRPIPFVDMDRCIGRLSSDDWENVTQLFQEYAETHYI